MRLPPWLRKLLVGAGVTVVVLLLVFFVAQAAFRRMGTRELAKVIDRIDAADPNWRAGPLLEARQKAAPPADRNPAAVAADVRKLLPEDWGKLRGAFDWGGGGAVTNELPGFWAVAWFLQTRDASAPARDAARAGFLRPEVLAAANGFAPLHVPDNPWGTLLPHVQNTREVFDLLALDAQLAVLEGRPARGVVAARAGVAAVTAIGDEPFLISQLVRLAGNAVAANAGLRVLAQAEVTDDAALAAYQAALRAEADFPWLLTGLRGERAMFDMLFDGLENGKIAASDLAGLMDHRANPVLLGAGFQVYKGFLPGDRAMGLKLISDAIDIAKRPPHEQKAAFKEWKRSWPFADGDSFRYLITRLTMPAMEKVADACVRGRATLLAASAAVACERFRLARGRWPESLDEIPPAILPPLPPDPYTGRPLQFRRVSDGVLVFTDADDLPKQREPNPGESRDPLEGIGRGFKLWNPELRGVTRPAPELPPEFFPDPPGLEVPP